jgi:serine protease AprX
MVLWPSIVSAKPGKLDRELQRRASRAGWSRVIVTMKPGASEPGDVRLLGGRAGRRLRLINGMVVDLPNSQLRRLADHPAVARIDHDRPTIALMATVSTMVGAQAVQHQYSFDGSGIGVAVIDSGVTNWHDDLTQTGRVRGRMRAGQRVAAFVDFVNGLSEPYDDNGHGTHVSGIIAGNGYDSRGERAGIAPGAHIVSLKVLDGDGRGLVSDVIAALDWAVDNRHAYNIRVINLSVGAAITNSYNEDPLALAAKRAVDAGIVVVTAAGNFGRNAQGEPQYGGITSPGNAPWVLTVGASSHQGTLNRRDDVVAPYSSRGPSAIDFAAKPDILAPGTGIVSLAAPESKYYQTKSAFLLDGSIPTAYKPYLSLTGTSMAAPVVSGTVALMLQANPNLTPNLVKALLQYTAQLDEGANALVYGAGFLNTKGAVDLAHYFATATPGARYPQNRHWSRRINWGNHRISGGVISPYGNAWDIGVVWGASEDGEGDNIVWGTTCDFECDNIVWGTAENEGDNIVWGTNDDGEGDNIVWGTDDDGEGDGEGDNIVWGTSGEGDNIVWGTSESDNIVWGTDCGGNDCYNIVWGTTSDDGEGDNIVWGTAEEGDNIVWGTSEDGEGDNIVWGTDDDGDGEGDNIVWGTTDEGDNIVWGTGSTVGDNIVWGTSTTGNTLWTTIVDPVTAFERLFDPPDIPVTRDGSASGGL